MLKSIVLRVTLAKEIFQNFVSIQKFLTAQLVYKIKMTLRFLDKFYPAIKPAIKISLPK